MASLIFTTAKSACKRNVSAKYFIWYHNVQFYKNDFVKISQRFNRQITKVRMYPCHHSNSTKSCLKWESHTYMELVAIFLFGDLRDQG